MLTYKRLSTITLFVISLGLSAIGLNGCGSASFKPTVDPQMAFFDHLSAQCGSSFTGSTQFVSSNDPNDPFVVNPLKIDIFDCTDKEIRIPFYVGTDSSRTWIITKTRDGLLFKHQHLLPDGSPDSITNYGGLSDGTGTEFAQHFPADEFTASLNSDYTTNKWSLILDPEKGVFEYKLQRHDKPRYEAYLVKVKE